MGLPVDGFLLHSSVGRIQVFPEVVDELDSGSFHLSSAAVAGHPGDVVDQGQHQFHEHLCCSVYGYYHQYDSGSGVDAVRHSCFRLRYHDVDVDEEVGENGVPEAPE